VFNVVVLIEAGLKYKPGLEYKSGVVVYILIESDRSALLVISVHHGMI